MSYMPSGRTKSVSLELATAYFASEATLPRCYQVKLNDVPPSALVIYVYCIVARSRLTDVATMAVIEWEMVNGGETQIAYCTEAVCMVTYNGTK